MTTPRAPAPLPRRARALLSAYRDAHAIPAAVEDRIWSVVGANEAPEPAFDPLEAVVPRRSSVRMIGWAGATLAAAAVLLLAWRLGGSLAERREPAPSPAEAVMQGEGGAQGRATARATPPSTSRLPEPRDEPAVAAGLDSPSATERDAVGSDPQAPARPRPAAAQAADRIPDAPPQPQPRETSTLAAEVALVAQARRGLADGDHARALEVVAEHARRFPGGLLAPERDAIESIARCRQGDGDGPQRASAFHRAHPRSPFADRVDEACGVTPRGREIESP